ncbi:MAG: SDR family oxidoreductase, partial [Lewinella sp.]|nr:SDR family oxidoreductase [Lewinella sp.]
EYGGDNIRANAIAPGWQGAGTRLADHFKADWSEQDKERFEQAIAAGTPMGRRGARRLGCFEDAAHRLFVDLQFFPQFSPS